MPLPHKVASCCLSLTGRESTRTFWSCSYFVLLLSITVDPNGRICYCLLMVFTTSPPLKFREMSTFVHECCNKTKTKQLANALITLTFFLFLFGGQNDFAPYPLSKDEQNNNKSFVCEVSCFAGRHFTLSLSSFSYLNLISKKGCIVMLLLCCVAVTLSFEFVLCGHIYQSVTAPSPPQANPCILVPL